MAYNGDDLDGNYRNGYVDAKTWRRKLVNAYLYTDAVNVVFETKGGRSAQHARAHQEIA